MMEQKDWSKLETNLANDCPNDSPPLERDHTSRLYVSSTSINGRTVFLRTYFTDNADYTAEFTIIRNLVKHTVGTQNFGQAKMGLGYMLQLCFDVTSSSYKSFASIIASSCSAAGKNVSFQISRYMVHSHEQVDAARLKYLGLMNIVFSKLKTKKFLDDDAHSNIYRIAHCMPGNSSTVVAIFSFLLQLCLVIYVILDNIDQIIGGDEPIWRNMPLATLVFFFSCIPVSTEIYNAIEARAVYRSIFSPLCIMDLLTNVLIPIIVLPVGFALILYSEEYIDAVLNSAALLFIAEIDDALPSLLSLDTSDIVKGHLLHESMKEFNLLTIDQFHESMPEIDYFDSFIVNTAENSSCGPYAADASSGAPSLFQTSYITGDCLLRKMEFIYTDEYPGKGRLGHLKLWKMDGTEVEFKLKNKGNNKKITIVGCFMIISCNISDTVIELRICGSSSGTDFVAAMDYFSLWDMDSSAQKMASSYERATETSTVVSPLSSSD